MFYVPYCTAARLQAASRLRVNIAFEIGILLGVNVDTPFVLLLSKAGYRKPNDVIGRLLGSRCYFIKQANKGILT